MAPTHRRDAVRYTFFGPVVHVGPLGAVLVPFPVRRVSMSKISLAEILTACLLLLFHGDVPTGHEEFTVLSPAVEE